MNAQGGMTSPCGSPSRAITSRHAAPSPTRENMPLPLPLPLPLPSQSDAVDRVDVSLKSSLPPSSSESMHVLVRIRPSVDSHQAGSSKAECVHAEDSQTIVFAAAGARQAEAVAMKYDRVFGAQDTQEDLFLEVAPRFIKSAIEG